MPTLRLLAAAVLASAAAAHSQTTGIDRSAPHAAAASTASSAVAMVEGEVRKIDKALGKVTLKHAAIPNLEMPPMTMVFKVADPKMLDHLKEGDKVRFSADRVNGTTVVTSIESPVR